MKKLKQQKGITLVALVITIIILLILAGISIASLTQTKLFGKAQQAKSDTETAQATENETLENYILQINAATLKTYNIGEQVTIGKEEFYVISDKGTTVELLAKYVLDGEAKEQINKDIDCVFSTSNYWKSETLPTSSPYFNLNTYPAIQNDKGSAVYKANNYAKSIGGISGRLLTYEEANSLKENYSDIIFVTYGDSKYYWLGSARNHMDVYGVYGRDNSFNVIRQFDKAGTYGVRPVIEISKSVIQ